jgi:antitoxin StbD
MMDVLFSTHSISISDLREAPARAFEQAGNQAVVVLNHNRLAGYILSSQLMARILDQLADRAVSKKTGMRLTTLKTARKTSTVEL